MRVLIIHTCKHSLEARIRSGRIIIRKIIGEKLILRFLLINAKIKEIFIIIRSKYITSSSRAQTLTSTISPVLIIITPHSRLSFILIHLLIYSNLIAFQLNKQFRQYDQFRQSISCPNQSI